MSLGHWFQGLVHASNLLWSQGYNQHALLHNVNIYP